MSKTVRGLRTFKVLFIMKGATFATQLGAMLVLKITQDKGAPWLRSVWHSEQGSVAVPQGPAGGGHQAATERSLRE